MFYSKRNTAGQAALLCGILYHYDAAHACLVAASWQLEAHATLHVRIEPPGPLYHATELVCWVSVRGGDPGLAVEVREQGPMSSMADSSPSKEACAAPWAVLWGRSTAHFNPNCKSHHQLAAAMISSDEQESHALS